MGVIYIDDNKGWISVYRNIQDCWIWKDDVFSRGQAWIDLLLLANHEDKKILFNGQLTVVERGQRITSIRQLCDRWKWSNRKVVNFLELLESDGMLVKKSDSKATLITIENYDKYQNVENKKATAKRQTRISEATETHTNNNYKQLINNDNNIGEKSNRFIPPTLEEVKAYCLERKNNVDAQKFIDHYTTANWYRGKTKIKDWKACIRTWEQNNKQTANTSTTKPNKFHNEMDKRTTNYTPEQLEEIGRKNLENKLKKLRGE